MHGEGLFDGLARERVPYRGRALVDEVREVLANDGEPRPMVVERLIDRRSRERVPGRGRPLVDEVREVLSGRDEPGLVPLERLIDGAFRARQGSPRPPRCVGRPNQRSRRRL